MDQEFQRDISSNSDLSLKLEFEVEEYDDEDSIIGIGKVENHLLRFVPLLVKHS